MEGWLAGSRRHSPNQQDSIHVGRAKARPYKSIHILKLHFFVGITESNLVRLPCMFTTCLHNSTRSVKMKSVRRSEIKWNAMFTPPPKLKSNRIIALCLFTLLLFLFVQPVMAAGNNGKTRLAAWLRPSPRPTAIRRLAAARLAAAPIPSRSRAMSASARLCPQSPRTLQSKAAATAFAGTARATASS